MSIIREAIIGKIRLLIVSLISDNVPNPLIGGAADYIVRRAIFMLEARKKSDSESEVNWLKALSDFMPVWEDLFAHQQNINH